MVKTKMVSNHQKFFFCLIYKAAWVV